MGEPSASAEQAYTLDALFGVKASIQLVPLKDTVKPHILLRREVQDGSTTEAEAFTGSARFSFVANKACKISKGQTLYVCIEDPYDEECCLFGGAAVGLEFDYDDNTEEEGDPVAELEWQGRDVKTLPPRMRKSLTGTKTYSDFVEGVPSDSLGFPGYPLSIETTPRVFASASVQTDIEHVPPILIPLPKPTSLQSSSSPKTPVQLPSPISSYEHNLDPHPEALEQDADFTMCSHTVSPMLLDHEVLPFVEGLITGPTSTSTFEKEMASPILSVVQRLDGEISAPTDQSSQLFPPTHTAFPEFDEMKSEPPSTSPAPPAEVSQNASSFMLLSPPAPLSHPHDMSIEESSKAPPTVELISASHPQQERQDPETVNSPPQVVHSEVIDLTRDNDDDPMLDDTVEKTRSAEEKPASSIAQSPKIIPEPIAVTESTKQALANTMPTSQVKPAAAMPVAPPKRDRPTSIPSMPRAMKCLSRLSMEKTEPSSLLGRLSNPSVPSSPDITEIPRPSSMLLTSRISPPSSTPASPKHRETSLLSRLSTSSSTDSETKSGPSSSLLDRLWKPDSEKRSSSPAQASSQSETSNTSAPRTTNSWSTTHIPVPGPSTPTNPLGIRPSVQAKQKVPPSAPRSLRGGTFAASGQSQQGNAAAAAPTAPRKPVVVGAKWSATARTAGGTASGTAATSAAAAGGSKAGAAPSAHLNVRPKSTTVSVNAVASCSSSTMNEGERQVQVQKPKLNQLLRYTQSPSPSPPDVQHVAQTAQDSESQEPRPPSSEPPPPPPGEGGWKKVGGAETSLQATPSTGVIDSTTKPSLAGTKRTHDASEEVDVPKMQSKETKKEAIDTVLGIMTTSSGTCITSATSAATAAKKKTRTVQASGSHSQSQTSEHPPAKKPKLATSSMGSFFPDAPPVLIPPAKDDARPNLKRARSPAPELMHTSISTSTSRRRLAERNSSPGWGGSPVPGGSGSPPRQSPGPGLFYVGSPPAPNYSPSSPRHSEALSKSRRGSVGSVASGGHWRPGMSVGRERSSRSSRKGSSRRSTSRRDDSVASGGHWSPGRSRPRSRRSTRRSRSDSRSRPREESRSCSWRGRRSSWSGSWSRSPSRSYHHRRRTRDRSDSRSWSRGRSRSRSCSCSHSRGRSRRSMSVDSAWAGPNVWTCAEQRKIQAVRDWHREKGSHWSPGRGGGGRGSRSRSRSRERGRRRSRDRSWSRESVKRSERSGHGVPEPSQRQGRKRKEKSSTEVNGEQGGKIDKGKGKAANDLDVHLDVPPAQPTPTGRPYNAGLPTKIANQNEGKDSSSAMEVDKSPVVRVHPLPAKPVGVVFANRGQNARELRPSEQANPERRARASTETTALDTVSSKVAQPTVIAPAARSTGDLSGISTDKDSRERGAASPGKPEVMKRIHRPMTLDSVMDRRIETPVVVPQPAPTTRLVSLLDFCLQTLSLPHHRAHALALDPDHPTFKQLSDLLVGVPIVVRFAEGKLTKKKTIRMLEAQAGRFSFVENGHTFTVSEHFKTTWNIDIRYPDIIGVNIARRGAKKVIVPLELCWCWVDQEYYICSSAPDSAAPKMTQAKAGPSTLSVGSGEVGKTRMVAAPQPSSVQALPPRPLPPTPHSSSNSHPPPPPTVHDFSTVSDLLAMRGSASTSRQGSGPIKQLPTPTLTPAVSKISPDEDAHYRELLNDPTRQKRAAQAVQAASVTEPSKFRDKGKEREIAQPQPTMPATSSAPSGPRVLEHGLVALARDASPTGPLPDGPPLLFSTKSRRSAKRTAAAIAAASSAPAVMIPSKPADRQFADHSSYQIEPTHGRTSPPAIEKLVVSGEGAMVAVVCSDYTVRIWERKARAIEIARLQPRARIIDVFWPTGRYDQVFVLDQGGVLSCWSAPKPGETEWKSERVLSLSSEPVAMACADQPASSLFAIATGKTIKIYDMNTTPPTSKNEVEHGGRDVTALAFIHVGNTLVVGCADGTVWVCNAMAGPLRWGTTLPGNTGVLALKNSPDQGKMYSRFLVSGRGDAAYLMSMHNSDKQMPKLERTFDVFQPLPGLPAARGPSKFGGTFVDIGGRGVLFGAKGDSLVIWSNKKFKGIQGPVPVHELRHNEGEVVRAVGHFSMPGIANKPRMILTGTEKGVLHWWRCPELKEPFQGIGVTSAVVDTDMEDESQRKRQKLC